MNDALAVFNALRTFARPASRAEIERESGLGYDQVHEGLRTLLNRGLLIKQVDAPRRRGLYQLIVGAQSPETSRGQYERTNDHREQQKHLKTAPAPIEDASRVQTAVRFGARGGLDIQRQRGGTFDVCALATFWKPR